MGDFLDRVTGGDTELQRLRQHPGRHLGRLRGDISTDMLMVSQTDRHPTEIARLRGARLVVGNEVEAGRTWAESKIKSLTGGDRLHGRFMRQDFFEFDPQFKLMIVGNNKPSLRGVDEAIRRRLHLIPFTVTIPPDERDTDLPKSSRPSGPASCAGPSMAAWSGSGSACPAPGSA